MQWNFTFYRFVSSSLFFLELVVKLSDYLWKANSLFSKYCVNCLLMFYFVYCNNCVLNDVNGACWCTCSFVALRVPHMCFWPAKTRKNLYFVEMHTCLWPGAQIWFRHKWRKLVTGSLYFIVLMGIVTVVIGIRFFSAVFHVLDWSFLLLHFDGNVCNWIPKVIWPWMDWFWVFCLEMASLVDFISVWTEICRSCSIFILFWRHQFFSMFRLRGILVCSLKMFLLFRRRILYYGLISFRNARQLHFLSFCVL